MKKTKQDYTGLVSVEEMDGFVVVVVKKTNQS